MNKLYKKILSLGCGCFTLAVSTPVSFASEKARWTSEEDQQLTLLVDQYGTNDWPTIATQMPNRNVRQCRERWMHYLCPNNTSSAWTPEMDILLAQEIQKEGPHWDRIARLFPNQSAVKCKNRWLSLNKQQPSLFQKIYDGFRGGFNWLARAVNPSNPLSKDYQTELITRGLKMEWNVSSAFKEDLCAYSALLAGMKIHEINPQLDGNTNITITYSDVCQFTQRLCEEMAVFNIFIGAPLDINFLPRLAEYLEYCIIVVSETPYALYRHNVHVFNPDAPKTIELYLYDQEGVGHYQIVTPQNVTIHYEDDIPLRLRSFVKFHPLSRTVLEGDDSDTRDMFTDVVLTDVVP